MKPEQVLDNYIDGIKHATELYLRQRQIVDVATFLRVSRANARIFIIGNGGSAATASHFAIDLVKRTRTHWAGYVPFQVITLDSIASLTAYSNDDGYEHGYANQLDALVTRGDILYAISASGKSPNIIRACKIARAHKALIISMTGFDGGELMGFSDENIHIPENNYALVEDAHSIICHMICEYIRARDEDEAFA